MTRRETRKYVIDVLRIREHKRRVTREAVDRLAQKLTMRYASAVINHDNYSTVTITP